MSSPDATFRGWTHFEGTVTGVTGEPADGTIDNNHWDSSGDALDASNQQHLHPIQVRQTGTAAGDTLWAWTVLGATATVVDVKVTNLSACGGSSTVTVDVRKNGVSILTSVVTLNSSTGDSGSESATLDGAQVAAVEEDVFTVVITPNQVGTEALASDVSVAMAIEEDYPT
jgi:hypothetical protein